jgi:hypothetical protein
LRFVLSFVSLETIRSSRDLHKLLCDRVPEWGQYLAVKLDLGEGIVAETRGRLVRLARFLDLHGSPVMISHFGFRLRGRSSLTCFAGLVGMFSALVAGKRADHYVDAATDEFRLEIRVAVRRNLAQEFMHHLKTDVRVGHFTAAELQGDLYLHVLAEEIDGMLDLHPKVVGIDLRAQLDFFYLIGVLMLLGFLVFLGLLVAELAEIDEPANRRIGASGDLDEIDTGRPRHVKGITQAEDAKLFAVGSDYPHFAGTDFPIYPVRRTGEGRRTWRKRATQDTLVS